MTETSGEFVASALPPKEKQGKGRKRWWVWLLFFLGGLCLLSLPLFTCMASWAALTGSAVPLGGGAPRVYREPVRGPAFGPEVAVVVLEGPIVSARGSTTRPIIAADRVVDLLHTLNTSSRVRAVVLAINSPGGGVAPSERIYHALKGMDKPVVAYFQDVAASGGYYIAMGAEEIVAHPSTLTGSIGVIAVFPHAERLLDKVGIGVVVVKSGPHKDMGSIFREMTPEERQHIQDIVDAMYLNFVEVVAQGRNLPLQEVKTLADGRIYSGEQALELGLVDHLGFEEKAVERAAALAGLTREPKVVRYYPGYSSWALLFQSQQPRLPWNLQLQLTPGLYYLWLP